jgi:hypothetical protein
MNTNNTDAGVTLTYYVVSGGVQTKNINVPANSRYTVVVHDAAEGVGRGKVHGTRVETSHTGGIVVERPLYYPNSGHNVMGAPAPRPTWYFAEGYTGTGFQEWLVVLNPNATVAPVTIVYYLESGNPIVKQFNVNANTRYTVSVHGTSEGVGPNQAVSAKVMTTHTGGIVVERPMNFTYNGSTTGVTGGHIVLGYAP